MHNKYKELFDLKIKINLQINNLIFGALTINNK